MKITPFRNDDVFDYFSKLRHKVTQEILGLDNEYVLKASQTELETYYITKNRIQPLTLYTDELRIDNQCSASIEITDDPGRGVSRGERVRVPGTTLDIVIRYEGDQRLWHSRPSGFDLRWFPQIEVQNDQVVLSISFPDDSVKLERLKSEIDEAVSSLAEAVENLHKDVDQHNESVTKEIKKAIGRKREMAQSVLGAVSALGIPMKRRDPPLSFVAPIRRRPSPAIKPTVETQRYQPEQVLHETEYNHILDVMRSMSLVMERGPKAFATLDEEAIRTHFLLQLNGHYEGGATGETFNVSGKTDILIRIENKNIFIAECKFWDGQKAFGKAIDQLLGYLTWRDAKCALLVFNKTKDSAGVHKKMHEVMEKRPEHRKTVSYDPNGDSRYVFVKESEPGREIAITTQLYNIPLPRR